MKLPKITFKKQYNKDNLDLGCTTKVYLDGKQLEGVMAADLNITADSVSTITLKLLANVTIEEELESEA